MELHRLTGMPENYDVSMFNEFYSKTANLRRKLASGIDHHRFGVTQDEIISWFDDKFLFVFNKYYHTKHDLLLGYIIQGLTLFKARILRAAYTEKYTQKFVSPDDGFHHIYLEDKYEEPEKTVCKDLLYDFLKEKISGNALFLMEIQLNPPPMIISTLDKEGKKFSKIPDYLLLKYLGIEKHKKGPNILLALQQEIKMGIDLAKKHFSYLTTS